MGSTKIAAREQTQILLFGPTRHPGHTDALTGGVIEVSAGQTGCLETPPFPTTEAPDPPDSPATTEEGSKTPTRSSKMPDTHN